MRTLAEIIEAAGGVRAIHEESVRRAVGTGDKPLTADAIRKWPSIGILDRHWPLIMDLTETTADELYQANLQARGDRAARQEAAE